MEDKFKKYCAALCHCETAGILQTATNNVRWPRLPEERQKQEDPTKNRKTGTCAIQSLVWLVWEGLSTGGAGCCVIHQHCLQPAHSLWLTKNQDNFLRLVRWRLFMEVMTNLWGIFRRLSGRWFTIIVGETADSSRKEHLMSNTDSCWCKCLWRVC